MRSFPKDGANNKHTCGKLSCPVDGKKHTKSTLFNLNDKSAHTTSITEHSGKFLLVFLIVIFDINYVCLWPIFFLPKLKDTCFTPRFALHSGLLESGGHFIFTSRRTKCAVFIMQDEHLFWLFSTAYC